jgi:ABC-type Fe3+/spermidine/putrescine transport system ATPase subunit
MRSELKQIQRRTGITFVYVTHDQAEALALSDDIAVMHQGVLQQYGPPREIYSHPANRIVADFMGQVNFLPARVTGVASGKGQITLDDGPALTMTLPAGVSAGAAVELAVRPENVRLSGRGNGSAIPGQVADLTFLGNTNEYIVGALGGARLRVQTHPSVLFAVGDAVMMDFDVDDCTVFARSGS